MWYTPDSDRGGTVRIYFAMSVQFHRDMGERIGETDGESIIGGEWIRKRRQAEFEERFHAGTRSILDNAPPMKPDGFMRHQNKTYRKTIINK